MTIEEENAYFVDLGLNPDELKTEDKEAMKQTVSFKFYELQINWEELSKQIRIKAQSIFPLN